MMTGHRPGFGTAGTAERAGGASPPAVSFPL